MQKIDLTKLYKAYYRAAKFPELVQIEAAHFLSLCGKGDPSGEGFALDLQALYSTAYALKFRYKALDKDFIVAKLEGLWSFDEQRYPGLSAAEAPKKIPRSQWKYLLLIRLPEFVGKEEVKTAIEQVFEKNKFDRVQDIFFHRMHEGKAVQMLHTGPFDTEPESLLKIQAFIEFHGLQRNGEHHEIYLSDFRKTPPEKLRTILREPVK